MTARRTRGKSSTAKRAKPAGGKGKAASRAKAKRASTSRGKAEVKRASASRGKAEVKRASTSRGKSEVKRASASRGNAEVKRASTSRGKAGPKKSAGKTSARSPGRSVYFFGDGRADGRAEQRALLGGKGANLAEMTRLGIPVPPGFTVATTVAHDFGPRGGKLPREVVTQVRKALARVERVVGARFGDPENPLLVSVRSGAPVSMPGMMDTVLNLGLNGPRPSSGPHRANPGSGERFAYDSYRRFVQMYGDVVLGAAPAIDSKEMDPFEDDAREDQEAPRSSRTTTELSALGSEGTRQAATRTSSSSTAVPQAVPGGSVQAQLWGAIERRVSTRGMNERAVALPTTSTSIPG